MNGLPEPTFVLDTVEALAWAWRPLGRDTDDARQEVVLAIYDAWRGWDPEKGVWLAWAGRQVKWRLQGWRRKENRARKQAVMEDMGVVRYSQQVVGKTTKCRRCEGAVFCGGLCQRCYRQARRRSGKDLGPKGA